MGARFNAGGFGASIPNVDFWISAEAGPGCHAQNCQLRMRGGESSTEWEIFLGRRTKDHLIIGFERGKKPGEVISEARFAGFQRAKQCDRSEGKRPSR